MMDINCTLPRTVGSYQLKIIYREKIISEVLMDSLGRDILLFPEPGLFHFEPWEYSLHLLKKENSSRSLFFKNYIFPKSACVAVNKNASSNHKY